MHRSVLLSLYCAAVALSGLRIVVAIIVAVAVAILYVVVSSSSSSSTVIIFAITRNCLGIFQI